MEPCLEVPGLVWRGNVPDKRFPSQAPLQPVVIIWPVPAKRADQKPVGVASRRAISFLIHRDRLGWHMPFTLCPSFLLAWGTKAGLGGGSAICDNVDATCLLREGGAGSWVPDDSSSRRKSLGLLLLWTFGHMRKRKPLFWLNLSTWVSLSCTATCLTKWL